MKYIDLLEVAITSDFPAHIERCGIYAAQTALRELDGSDRLSIADHKRIPSTRAEIHKREGDGWAMAVAAMSGLESWVSENPVHQKGWFRKAMKQARKAARKVFLAGSFASPCEEIKECITREGILDALTKEPTREEWRYRTRHGRRFYVYDAVVLEKGSSIQEIAEPKNSAVSKAKRVAMDTIRALEAYYGPGGYVNSVSDRIDSWLKIGHGERVINYCYELRSEIGA